MKRFRDDILEGENGHPGNVMSEPEDELVVVRYDEGSGEINSHASSSMPQAAYGVIVDYIGPDASGEQRVHFRWCSSDLAEDAFLMQDESLFSETYVFPPRSEIPGELAEEERKRSGNDHLDSLVSEGPIPETIVDVASKMMVGETGDLTQNVPGGQPNDPDRAYAARRVLEYLQG